MKIIAFFQCLFSVIKSKVTLRVPSLLATREFMGLQKSSLFLLHIHFPTVPSGQERGILPFVQTKLNIKCAQHSKKKGVGANGGGTILPHVPSTG